MNVAHEVQLFQSHAALCALSARLGRLQLIAAAACSCAFACAFVVWLATFHVGFVSTSSSVNCSLASQLPVPLPPRFKPFVVELRIVPLALQDDPQLWDALLHLDDASLSQLNTVQLDVAAQLSHVKQALLQDSIYEFSRHKGLLMLSRNTQKRLNVTRYVVEMNASCFGDGVQATHLDLLLGYDTVIHNVFFRTFGPGFVAHEWSGLISHLRSIPWHDAPLIEGLLQRLWVAFIAILGNTVIRAATAQCWQEALHRIQIVAQRPFLIPPVIASVSAAAGAAFLLLGIVMVCGELLEDRGLSLLYVAHQWALMLLGHTFMRLNASVLLFASISRLGQVAFLLYALTFGPLGFLYEAAVAMILTTMAAGCSCFVCWRFQRFWRARSAGKK